MTDGIVEKTTPVDGVRLFTLQARVDKPQGLICALHGGGYDANYWHHPGLADASLLHLGAALGYDVIAPDRPGVARSSADAPAGLEIARQCDLLFGLIEQERAGDCPVYVIGHSLGGITALTMAAHSRASDLAGIDVSGVPVRFSPERLKQMQDAHEELVSSGSTSGALMPPEHRRAMFFGEDGSFDPAVVAWGDTEHPVAPVEMQGVFEWVSLLPTIAGSITTPLQWVSPVIENSSEAGPEVLEEMRAMFTASEHVRFEMQPHSGHNISLHHVARAYHLRAIAFFEEVAAMQRA